MINRYLYRSKVGLLAFVLATVPAPRESPQPPRAQVDRDAKWEQRLVQRFPCQLRPRGVIAERGISTRLSCALALAAIREIKEGRTRALGISSADTAIIHGISVTGLYLHGLGGTADEVFWSVKIDFGDARPMLDVRFDRVLQRIRPYLAEGNRRQN